MAASPTMIPHPQVPLLRLHQLSERKLRYFLYPMKLRVQILPMTFTSGTPISAVRLYGLVPLLSLDL
jgi:hypothetical protein